ncbi:MAG: preprotein translocase subunit SecG [Gammaproteobacteria bacterium]|nr:preprotein translocase subunit SecG [Gammaproteobacteria bacterium]
MTYTIVLMFHVFIAMALTGLILLQHGKGADAGAAFGAGSSGTVFGARGAATFLSRTTGVLALLFVITSLSLAHFIKRSAPTSVIEAMEATEITEPALVPGENGVVIDDDSMTIESLAVGAGSDADEPIVIETGSDLPDLQVIPVDPNTPVE